MTPALQVPLVAALVVLAFVAGWTSRSRRLRSSHGGLLEDYLRRSV
jgi:hypothetical protein